MRDLFLGKGKIIPPQDRATPAGECLGQHLLRACPKRRGLLCVVTRDQSGKAPQAGAAPAKNEDRAHEVHLWGARGESQPKGERKLNSQASEVAWRCTL
jgi:hypothetical protein